MPTNTRYNAVVRICAVIGIFLLNYIVFTIGVRAAVSDDITVTGSPLGLFPPTNFVATTITDNKIRLTWTSDPLAVTTHIRGKVGGYPVGVADGYEIYNGAGNTVDDDAVSLDDTAANVYYVAYSVNGGGVHSTNHASANTGGVGMTLIAFFGGALILTWIGLRSSYGILKFMAGVFWFADLTYWLNGLRPATITAGSPTDQIVVLLCVGVGLAMMLMPWWYSKTENGQETGGKFRLPFMPEETEEEPERYAPTRQERASAYSARINGALNGRRQRFAR